MICKSSTKKREIWNFLLILVEIFENQTPNQVVLCPNHGDVTIMAAEWVWHFDVEC